VAPYCKDYHALLLANHGALAWGETLIDSWYRLESLEHYAMILMYTGNIIGKANVLSCEQIRELIKIREKLGILSGGVPPCCAAEATNLADVGGPVLPRNASGSGAQGGAVNPSDIEAIVRSVLHKLGK
jgi:L-fuculose-phosphate aldolase